MGAAALSGCGGGSADLGTASSGTAVNKVSSGTSSISGNAVTTALVGKVYSFQPQGTGATGAAVTYTITNKPTWASFDSSTGQLSGTPAANDVGTYQGVQIAANDGKSTSTLPAFAVTVSNAAAGVGNVSLAWEAPTQNSDGTQLQDLQGYKIHYGTESQNYTGSITVDNPTLTTYLVDNLPAGTYYFAVTAYNQAGLESSASEETKATFN